MSTPPRRERSPLKSISSSQPAKSHKKKIAVIVLLFFLGFLGILAISNIFTGKKTSKKLAPLPQDPYVQVYMNHSQAAEYTEPYRKINRMGDDLEQLIVEAIQEANLSLDVAVQELRLPKIARAIADRSSAGVKVRVILENNYSRPWSEFTEADLVKFTERERDRYNEFRQLADSNKDNHLTPDEIAAGDSLIILRNARVPVIDDTADGSKGSGLMHHKFVIIDRTKLIVTSANFTTSDIHGDFKTPASRGNANNLLKIESAELAALFADEFNIMWGDGPADNPDSKFGTKKPFRPERKVTLGNSSVAVQFSPTNKKVPWEESGNGAIAKTIGVAAQSINMALFVFSEQQIANKLETLRQRDVKVRVLIEPSFAYRNYSELLDMMGVAIADNCEYELDNHPWQNPIDTAGVPQLPPGDFLHHKFAVVDSQTVLTGSHNWSKAANSNNDETLLAIQSPLVAAHFEREFERLYASARLGVPATLKQKIQEQQKQCPQMATVAQTDSKEQPVSAISQPFIESKNQKQSAAIVNLNAASVEELETLPGVGRKLALRIVEARQQQPFTSIEDLDRVPGVGPKMLEKLRDRVTW